MEEKKEEEKNKERREETKTKKRAYEVHSGGKVTSTHVKG